MPIRDNSDKKIIISAKAIDLQDKRKYIAYRLGLVDYNTCLKLQQNLQQKRLQNLIPNVLLLLEHIPVYTVGHFSTEEDIIVPRTKLLIEEISILKTDRGGKITYHGPGQIVGYPILNLKEINVGVREYVWKLEEVIINLLKDFYIKGNRSSLHAGVWVGDKKICSLGIHVTHYITTHGFALNINNDLKYFEYIRPCGLPGKDMTSISKLLGYHVEMKTIEEGIQHHFSSVFGLECIRGDQIWITVQDCQNG